MDAKTCLQKLQYVGVLAFATVDEHGAPQIRNISAIHYEPEAMYFFTAKGKDFCRQLLADGRVQILGYTKYKEMIRLSAHAKPVCETEQQIGLLFKDRINPFLLLCFADRFCMSGQPDHFFVDTCIGCDSCAEHCPQRCIEPRTPYQIQQEH